MDMHAQRHPASTTAFVSISTVLFRLLTVASPVYCIPRSWAVLSSSPHIHAQQAWTCSSMHSKPGLTRAWTYSSMDLLEHGGPVNARHHADVLVNSSAQLVLPCLSILVSGLLVGLNLELLDEAEPEGGLVLVGHLRGDASLITDLVLLLLSRHLGC